LPHFRTGGRPQDAGDGAAPLFLSAAGLPARSPDGRLSVRAVNLLLEQMSRWHDAESIDPRASVKYSIRLSLTERAIARLDFRHYAAFRRRGMGGGADFLGIAGGCDGAIIPGGPPA
jgi:hypothetical protein